MVDATAHKLEAGGTEVPMAAGGARQYRKPLKAFRWCDIKAFLGESFEERSRAPGDWALRSASGTVRGWQ